MKNKTMLPFTWETLWVDASRIGLADSGHYLLIEQSSLKARANSGTEGKSRRDSFKTHSRYRSSFKSSIVTGRSVLPVQKEITGWTRPKIPIFGPTNSSQLPPGTFIMHQDYIEEGATHWLNMHALPQGHKVGCTLLQTFWHASQSPLAIESSRSATRHVPTSPSISRLIMYHIPTQKCNHHHNHNEGGNQNIPNTSSSSLWTFFWASGLRPSKYRAQFIPAAVVSWP